METEEKYLCCMVHPLVKCGGCGTPLCDIHGVGHRGDTQKGRSFCRSCWWNVWNEALYQSKVSAQRNGTNQVQEMNRLMGYNTSEEIK